MPGRSPRRSTCAAKRPSATRSGKRRAKWIQAESAAPWHRRNTVLLDEVRQRPRCTSYAERSSTCIAFEHVHAEHALVVLDRALQIADLQVNRADVSLLGQTLRRLNTVERRDVSHFRTHHFTSCFQFMSGPAASRLSDPQVVADQESASFHRSQRQFIHDRLKLTVTVRMNRSACPLRSSGAYTH